jgi:eukaryotic-like serine/threonine-protein kinase
VPTIPWDQVREVVDAVLDLPPDQRSPYLDKACQQPAVRRYVESLVLSYQQAGEFLDEPALAGHAEVLAEGEADSWKGRRVGPYQVIEEIGEGGMGSVYRAMRVDDQYQKQVAIKVVRSGFDTRFALTRFKAERQILANLEHPNIARLLEGGSTEDGQPYFVMEYIQGQPLDQYCDDHKLTITERLRLFRTVCSAVQYAHQNLVIHRDIKPNNILVNAEGVPKLLDFGIAKILSADQSDSLKTMTMVRLLTPEYASPEQLLDEPITTASDIYSLGVVLYELLTGQRPYRFTTRKPDEIARVVSESEPQKPSAAVVGVNESTDIMGKSVPRTPEAGSGTREGSPEKLRRRLSGDLDNIVLMALRKEPQRRYASVEQLSEDLRRHLEGLPVIARTDTFGYRSGKFVRRHTAGVTTAALVVLSLTVGLAFALREAKIARQQRARAEQRFNDVRTLANSLIFDVHDSIADLSGSTAARKLIVDKALHYLDSLSRESQGDLSLQRELAAAYKRIGDVQGDVYSANLGDSAGSLASYQKALEIREVVFATNPANVTDSINLAQSLHCVADALLLKGETDQAWKDVQRSVETIEPLVNAHPNDLPLLQELAADYTSEASILGGNFNLSNLGDTANALVVRQKQVDVRERIFQSDPSNANKGEFAIGLTMLGDQFLLLGQRHTALDYYLRSQKMFEDLASGSTGRKAKNRLYSIYNRINTVQQANGNLPESLVYARKALKIAQELSQADPNDVYSRVSLTLSHSNLADVLSSMHRFAPAVSSLNQAIAIIDPLVAKNPTNGEFPGVQATTYVTAGDVFRRSRDYDRSLNDYRVAVKILSQIHLRDPDNVDAGLELAGSYNQLGKLLVLRGDLDGATEAFHKGLAISEPQATSQNPNEEALYSAAASYAGLAEAEAKRTTAGQALQVRFTHLNQARLWDERSLQLWSKVKEPGFLSPDGYDSEPPPTVKQHLARVNSALTELKGKRQNHELKAKE